MNTQYRVITWNCRRAKATSAVWDYLLDLAPDVALLQEIGELPERVAHHYDSRLVHPRKKTGGDQRFQTGILVRGSIIEPLPMSGPYDWVDEELEYFAGNLPAFSIELENGIRLNAVSVYSPAWPVSRSRLKGLDISDVKLTQNPDVWVADLLWASLKHHLPNATADWLIAGDFNSSETFDQWPGGPRGNREYLDRMASLGLVECLRHVQGQLTPTFRNARGGEMKHQMDHLFVTSGVAAHLASCETGSAEQVLDRGLSDHLPIVADFTSE